MNSNVTLDFVGLLAIDRGIINFEASHITLDRFKIRFQDPTVNFTSGERAVISHNEGQKPRVDLNIKRRDIQAPVQTAPFYNFTPPQALTVPTTRFDTYDSGTIQDNVISGGTINVQGGPWMISGNKIPAYPVFRRGCGTLR